MQESVLREILRINKDTVFGKIHRFGETRSVAEFRDTNPVCDYEDLKPFIDRMGKGEPGVLTWEAPILFERSSGSTSASKLIPFNNMLQTGFNRALHPWMADLFLNNPGIWGGPSYWVITPLASQNERTSGGIPIGFQADSEYFGKFSGSLVDRLMAVPSWLRGVQSIDNFRYITLLFLLRAENLRLISLWNPSFMTFLLDELFTWADSFINDIICGSIRPPSPGQETPEIAKLLEMAVSPLPRRAERVKEALRGAPRGRVSGLGEALWPNLGIISSWTDGEAAAAIPKLKEWFPRTQIQGKGLLATEGIVSIPISGSAAPVLAARSAFFEFQEGEDGDQPVRYAWEVEAGRKYRVILTTNGGLYRYRLNDIVQIKSFWGNFPCLSFIGKESLVSDLCGEKLNARHVEAIISRLIPESGGAFLAPEGGNPPGYVFFLPAGIQDADFSTLRERLELGLRENFHYDWCRKVGQLRRAEIILLPYGSEELLQLRMKRLYQEKLRLGVVKTLSLSPLKNWKTFLL